MKIYLDRIENNNWIGLLFGLWLLTGGFLLALAITSLMI